MKETSIYFIKEAIKRKKQLEAFVLQKSKGELPSHVNHNQKENYCKIKGLRYYLTTADWNHMYHMILQDQPSQEMLDIKQIQQDLVFVKFKQKIIKSLKAFITKGHLFDITNKKSVNIKIIACFNIIIKEQEIYYGQALYYAIQDRILRDILKNKIEYNSEYSIPETKINYLIGKCIYDTYFYNHSSLNVFKKHSNYSLTELEISNIQQIWLAIFLFYNQTGSTKKQFTEKELDLFKKHFKIYDEFLLNISAYKFFLEGLIYFQTEKDHYIFNNITCYLEQHSVTVDDLHTLELFINDIIKSDLIKSGSVITNHFCDEYLFKSFRRKGDKQLWIAINTNISQEFIVNSSFFKPYLIPENKHLLNTEIISIEKESIPIHLKLDKITRIIHENADGKGFFHGEQNPFVEDPTISDINLAIDKTFLDDFINYFSQYINKEYQDFSSVLDKEALYIFLSSIYGIDFENLTNTKLSALLLINEKFIKFALDFNLDVDFKTNKQIVKEELIDAIKTLEKHVPDLFKSLENQLNQYIYKITAYKNLLRSALTEFILYSLFDYFIMPSFFDFRGRRYFIGLIFNIQSYPFLKAFLKQREFNYEMLTSEQFINLRETICSLIKDNKIKEKISIMMQDFPCYKKTINSECNKFLYNCMDSTLITENQFNTLLEETLSFEILYKKIYEVIKKKSETIIITSFIRLEQERKFKIIPYVNAYCLDMVISGYQNLSILSRNKKLAEFSNLIGNEKKDLYQIIADGFYEKMVELTKFAEEFVYITYKISLTSINKDQVLFMGTLKECFIHFLFTDKIDNIFETIKILYINEESLRDNIYTCEEKFLENEWILTTSEIKEHIKKHTQHKYLTMFGQSLLILRRIVQYMKLLQNNPWIDKHILKDRYATKPGTMIEIYGGTREGRKKAFQKYITDKFLILGIMVPDIVDKSYLLFHYLENFFVKFKSKNMNQIELLKNLGQRLVETNNAIEIKNMFFTCRLYILKQQIQRLTIRTLTDRKPYQLNIQKPVFIKNTSGKLKGVIDMKKQQSKFPPNFIHGMDAMSVHLIIVFYSKLKKHTLIPDCEILTIHDAFAGGKFLFPILPFILQENYKLIYNYNYVESLRNNFPNDNAFNEATSLLMSKDPFESDEICNCHFVKYG